jgi:hypothetical protein
MAASSMDFSGLVDALLCIAFPLLILALIAGRD